MELFQGGHPIRTDGNFAEAHKHLTFAANGFAQIGHQELKDLSVGMAVYSDAIIQIQNLNLGRALELLNDVKAYLDDAGKYGSRFEPLIDHMEPEIFFASSLNAVMRLDYAKAQTLIDRATQAAEHVAETYYEKGEQYYNTFMGYGRLYQAFYRYLRSMNDFNLFNYDDSITDPNLAKDAKLAKELFEQGDTGNLQVKASAYLADALDQLMEVVCELATIMRTIFSSTFKADLKTLKHLKGKLRAANKAASNAGPHAEPLVRLCTQLVSQINNLERLAKPGKGDFGKFSGLVACALFLPVFIIISWANAIFGLELGGKAIISPSLILALIGGFGFGAVKFRSLLMGG